ncbi:CKLF-like MARVEL transmembrane domain-containing protein 8 [Fukomys damarensis]|uniref:CKLF-like MARVEL transmembrane domain-containing protein 8 n=1 Tax=Fukomys damarensis TaxID=885580 RepID=UPI001455363F|nr:CKLF-like MARVEL transmembrane domain-containing protein 8 [Fukomys damarensis]
MGRPSSPPAPQELAVRDRTVTLIHPDRGPEHLFPSHLGPGEVTRAVRVPTRASERERLEAPRLRAQRLNLFLKLFLQEGQEITPGFGGGRGRGRSAGRAVLAASHQPERARSHTVNTTTSSFAENFSTTSSSLAYDREFLRTLPGLLIVAEIVLGLLVWTLIAGTEYFRVPAFGWVMFVAVFYWVLTVFFLIIYITMTYTRIPQVPWTTVGLCFNGSAFILYLSAAVVDATSVSPERDSHNFNSWAASSFFAFLVTICYAGNTYFSFIAWRSRTIQ